MKNNLINQNTKKKENNYNNNYTRCASVEERFNNPHFSHNLEKEYLDVKFIVKNSVEKINILFNNEEFKQKASSKKIFNNFSNRININRCDLNKENNNNDNFDKEENKKDLNTFQYFINVSRRDKNKKLSKFSVNEEDEYAYNSNNNNDLLKELKDLNSNKNKNNELFTDKKLSLKTCKSNEIDSINSSLLNLESNKLYSKKEQNLNLKKINISENTNLSMKNKDKKYKNPFISNNLKTENENDFTVLKDKKKDILKYIQKGNKNKKSKQHPINLKTRNSNKQKVFSEKCSEEESNRFSNTQKLRRLNNSLQKDINSGKKNNSNSMLIDINYNINSDNNNLNINNNNKDKKISKDHNKLLSSIGKYLYKGEKREIAIHDLGRNDDEYINNKKYLYENKNKKNFKNGNNSIINNKNNKKKIVEKIKTQDFMKSLLILNEYLISNNLFEDYSNIQNKKLINDLSLFLANNIKNNNNTNKNKNKYNKINEAAIKIQKKWRKIKIEKYLINNFMEEDYELKKMLLNDYIQKSKVRNNKIIDIFYNIINNCKLIYNNIEDIDKIFDIIQKVIQRNLTINDENLLYKEYINKVICNK